MRTPWEDVFEFHRQMGLRIGERPEVPEDTNVVGLCVSLVEEELNELMFAVETRDVAEVADAAADLIYVILGLCVSFGIDLRPVWNAVQEANMKKLTGPKRSDGKQLKPPDWRPPDIASIIEQQLSLFELLT